MKRLDEYEQHFLRSPKVVAELIGHSTIRKNDIVYDLGAGSGIISSVLARRCRQVFAVEIEPKTIELLRQNTKESENIAIIKSDIMKLPVPDGSYKIFANPPFSLSSNIIERFLFSNNPPKATYLVVQRQFARKLMLEANHFTSQLGMSLGPIFSTRIRKPLRKTDFFPHPAVDTVLLEIKRREEPLLPASQLSNYYEYINYYFTHPPEFYARIGKQIKPSSLKLSEWLKPFVADAGDRHE